MVKVQDPSESDIEDQQAVLRMAYGALSTQVLHVAAALGIADHLRDRRQTPTELAPKLGVDDLTLQRVLRGLVSLGICDQTDDGQFGLTPRGQYLRSDHPDSLHARVLFYGQAHYFMWAHLLETVKTGVPASQIAWGMSSYDYYASNPAIGALFDKALAQGSRHSAVVDAYDFGQFESIVDVGGGNGALMVEVLNAHPQPKGIVFDLPRVIPGAEQNIEAAGLAGRCQCLVGDALKAVPSGGDAYILSNVLGHWRDDQAGMLLRNCREAMESDGKLLIVEWVMPSGNEDTNQFRFWETVTFDIHSLAGRGSGSGHVRTGPEFEALLEASGFTLTALIPTRSSFWVIEATPR